MSKHVSTIACAAALLCLLSVAARGQAGQTQPDTAAYGLTPEEYRPFSRFENPYKEFFLTLLEYPGYGRNIPEPDTVETVKIGFIGPIMRTVAESYGGPEEVPQRVNQRMEGCRFSFNCQRHVVIVGAWLAHGRCRIDIGVSNCWEKEAPGRFGWSRTSYAPASSLR